MKKVIVLTVAFILGTFLFVGTTGADTDIKNRLPIDYEVKAPASNMEPTTIDGVPVPYEVLVYAQVVYQGYAVTQARETTWNGSKAYQLRIDNDSNPHDANGMYLLYDVEWKLIDNKPLNAPLPVNRKSGVDKQAEEKVDEVVEESVIETAPPLEDDENDVIEEEVSEDTEPIIDNEASSDSGPSTSDEQAKPEEDEIDENDDSIDVDESESEETQEDRRRPRN